MDAKSEIKKDSILNITVVMLGHALEELINALDRERYPLEHPILLYFNEETGSHIFLNKYDGNIKDVHDAKCELICNGGIFGGGVAGVAVNTPNDILTVILDMFKIKEK